MQTDQDSGGHRDVCEHFPDNPTHEVAQCSDDLERLSGKIDASRESPLRVAPEGNGPGPMRIFVQAIARF